MSMENNKKVVVSGPLMPSTKDTPIDARTRVATLDDIVNIQVPYVGMIFFVISEGKHYTVKSLKSKDINGIIVENALVDEYEEFGTHIDIDLSEFATEELVEELAAEMRENDADIREMIESIADGNGLRGEDGKSAYEVAVENGFKGSEKEWLESLRGEVGPQGEVGPIGPQGEAGPEGPIGPAGEKGEAFRYEDFTPEQLEDLVKNIEDGVDGKSAFEIAKEHGFEGSEEEWLESLRGPQGEVGPMGPEGPKGKTGASAYMAWKTIPGNEEGTVEDFMESLRGEVGPQGPQGEKGDKGENGLSAYMLAKTYDGFVGSMQEWLDTLVGPIGPAGEKGEAFKYEDFTPEQLAALKGPIGEKGENGLSAYMLAKKYDGFEGTLPEWLDSLKGNQGPRGEKGEPFRYEDFTEEQLAELVKGIESGAEGKSAYEVAVKNGFKGSEKEWLESLRGPEGPKGKTGASAYMAWKTIPGNEEGTVEDFMESLRGEAGPAGEQGPMGPQGPKGEAFKYEDFTPEQLEALRGPQGPAGDSATNAEVEKLKAELLEARKRLADLTYGVEYEWIYFCEQPKAGENTLSFNKETAPEFYKEWSPIYESGDETSMEEFITKMYEEDIYRMYVLRLTIEHRIYNRYEFVPLQGHTKQPGVSEFLKGWAPTSKLTSWNWSSDEDGGFTIDVKPSSGLVIAFMKVKEEYRIK